MPSMNHLERCCVPKRTAEGRFCKGDFNALVGEIGTAGIGPRSAQREDSNGPFLRAFTDEHELVLQSGKVLTPRG